MRVAALSPRRRRLGVSDWYRTESHCYGEQMADLLGWLALVILGAGIGAATPAWLMYLYEVLCDAAERDLARHAQAARHGSPIPREDDMWP